MPDPLAVVEKQGNRTWVIACNDVAAGCGVRVGMAAPAAQALAGGLIVRKRDPAAERESLAGLAVWAGRFTPAVSIAPPGALLLEISTCLSLHRGLANLLQQARSGIAEMGYAATMACAPSSHGAWLLAKAGIEKAIRERTRLQTILAALPVALLEQPPAVVEGLERVGAKTLGECLRLPRGGMARRFGQALIDELDRALGRLPEARAFFEPPPSFERSLELPAPVYAAEALLFAARRLLPELEGFLVLRQSGVQELELVCRHERRAPTVLKLGFARPTRDAGRMQLLLRETLGRTRLPAAAHTIVLRAPLVLPLAGSSGDLFQTKSAEADGDLLLERLRIRLGEEAVYGIESAADHRPERAWRSVQDQSRAGAVASRHRPLWLLPQPLPCHDGRLKLKSGPERIESGWWDGGDVARDYYMAEDRNGAQLWVYCDRASGEWYLHGVFA
ncbi:MAG: Y-family DNA polymerase [Hyphomicrobiaceae bacterium]